jgi:putative ABC transport system permease protein
MMSGLLQTSRIALRQLWKAPGFTLTVVLTLALGIGAAAAIFSLIEGVLLRPLPFREPERLMLIGDHLGGRDGIGVTAREIETYTATTTAFASIGGYAGKGYETPGGEGNTPEEIPGMRLTAGVFPTLGVEPLLGRVFTRAEEDGNRQVAVISYAMWLNRFHRDTAILGRTIDLDNQSYTVIGVMPRSFEFPVQVGRLNHTQVWVPMSLTPDELAEAHEGVWAYQMVARLRDGVTVQQAALDVDRVAQLISRNFPPSMAVIKIRGDAAPLRERVLGNVRPMLNALLGAVGIVLLIACVNVAGLLLVRAIRRRREYAVRLALGASSGRILLESIVEGTILSIAGGLLGLGFAAGIIRVALHLLPESMPRIDQIAINGRVAGFALLLAGMTGALCSLAPAFAATRTRVMENLKQSSQSTTGTGSHAQLRSALVVVEIAIALVLLTSSGAFLRSFEKMRSVDPGFQPDHVLVAGYQLPMTRYSTFASAKLFHHSVVERMEGKPQIAAAGLTNSLPASGFTGQAAYTIEGVPVANWKLTFASFGTVSGDYFRAIGIPLLAGRYFTRDDRANTPLVVIVNASMAKHCWPGQGVMGKRMHVGNPRKGYPWATVIGVIADTKLGARDEPTGDQWYAPDEQPATLFGNNATEALLQPAGGYLVVRSALPPEQMIGTLRATVAEIDPSLVLRDVKSMEEVMANVEAPRRFNTDLITTFAIGALLLAITGIYAVVAFSVSQRTQEIAIRMAVGAQRAGIARLVLVSGTKLALLGCGLGVLGSLAVSRTVSAFLFDVSATDPLIYAGSVALMLLVALLASAQPAIRAASADPTHALRAN